MNFTQKNADKYFCEFCDFKCFKHSDYERHVLTPKHKNRTFLNVLEQKKRHYICEKCNKKYSVRNSLWYHKKKCFNKPNLKDEEMSDIFEDKNEIIKYLMKENTEFKEMIMEQNKVVMKIYETSALNISNNNININSNNKTFNLNVFLNEHCKDAMNINEFVDSLKLQLTDLESVGKLGFVEGISNIIVKKLKALDIHKRPVHCSDSKREVMYVKDEDKWEKENDDKIKMHKVIKQVANKNARLIPAFKEKHPDCIRGDSKYTDQYNKLIVEAMGGSGDNDMEKEDKIIKKIAKEVTIDKMSI